LVGEFGYDKIRHCDGSAWFKGTSGPQTIISAKGVFGYYTGYPHNTYQGTYNVGDAACLVFNIGEGPETTPAFLAIVAYISY